MVRTFLVLLLCAASAFADAASAAVGHWHIDMAGVSTADLYLQRDGRFRWVMTTRGQPQPLDSPIGAYKLVEGVLELYYDTRPQKPQKWKCTIDGDKLSIGAMTDTETVVYTRVHDTK